jgi:SOS response associated peptidase (SRAP)
MAYPRLRGDIARPSALEPHSLLVPGPGGGTKAHRRPVRDGVRAADVPRSVPEASLHRAGRWFLRVESDQRAEGEAAPCDRNQGRRPFGIAGIWENWKDPNSGEWVRTFAIITTDANELVAGIHDRMPVILAPADSMAGGLATNPIHVT